MLVDTHQSWDFLLMYFRLESKKVKIIFRQDSIRYCLTEKRLVLSSVKRMWSCSMFAYVPSLASSQVISSLWAGSPQTWRVIWSFMVFIIKCSLSVVERQVSKANLKPTVLSVKLYDLGRKCAFRLYLFMCIIKAAPCGRETLWYLIQREKSVKIASCHGDIKTQLPPFLLSQIAKFICIKIFKSILLLSDFRVHCCIIQPFSGANWRFHNPKGLLSFTKHIPTKTTILS